MKNENIYTSIYRILEQPSQHIESYSWPSGMEFIPQYYSEKGTWENFYDTWITKTVWFFFKTEVGTRWCMFRTLEEAIEYLDKHTGKIKLPPTTKVHPYPNNINDPE